MNKKFWVKAGTSNQTMNSGAHLTQTSINESELSRLRAKLATAEAALTQAQQERDTFHAQLKMALGLPDDGRIWMGTGLLTRAETLVTREKERSALMEALEPWKNNWFSDISASIEEINLTRVYEQVKKEVK